MNSTTLKPNIRKTASTVVWGLLKCRWNQSRKNCMAGVTDP